MKRCSVFMLVILLAACGGAAQTPSSPAASPASAAASAAPGSGSASVASSSSAPASAASASAPASAVAAASSSAANAGPKPTTTLTVGTALTTTTLDPHQGSSPPEFEWRYPIFDALVQMDDQGKPQASLATSWKNVDPTTWQFTLRQNVQFSNGEPFDSAAVKFSYDRLLDPNRPATLGSLASRLSTFASVEAPDKNTVVIKTKTPNPTVPLIASLVFIIPPKTFQDMGEKAYIMKPVGTGWFKVQDFQPNDHLTLVASDNSWHGYPKVGTLKMLSIVTDASRLAALQSGQLDIMQEVVPDRAETLKSQYQIATALGGGAIQGMLNTLKGPLTDKRIRQALNYAVDKQTIVNQLLRGYGKPAEGQITGSDAFGYNPDLKAYEYDPNKAKQLLDQAGVKDLTISIHGLQNPAFGKDVADAISGYLSKVGVKTDEQILEQKVWLDEYYQGPRPDVFLIGLNYEPMYDASFVLTWYTSKPVGAVPTWNNADYDKLWTASQAEFDQTKRQQDLRQMEAIMREEAPALFLWQADQINALAKGVNWKPGPGNVRRFENASKS